jgi:hypothetical protein
MHPSARAALLPALEVVTAFTQHGHRGDQGELFWAHLTEVVDDEHGRPDGTALAELLFGLVQLSALLAEQAASAGAEPLPTLLQRVALTARPSD